MPPDTDVAVVGGGATGCGVARDLAMRGLDVTLLERGSLNGGTSGRSHGLLHSGARYADVDPDSARACRAESGILRRIGGGAVAETGGFFLQLSGDDPAYFEAKLEACRECGIDVDEVSSSAVRAHEPSVTAEVERALSVPDAVVYPSRLVAATAASAREHGATIRTGTAVTDIDTAGDAVTVGLEGTDSLGARHVVNAAGAWAGRVAALADVDVSMAPTRGTMVAFDFDGVSAVLNRCRPQSDGDIVVPHPDSVVCGTTSEPVDGPDGPEVPAREVEALRAAGAQLVPGLADAPVRRSFAGVRPLHDPGGRAATRGFDVLDHAERDGVSGLTTVVGGKLTTYRLMAEAVADQVAERLGVPDSCRTAEEPLPGHDDPSELDALVEAFGTAAPADADVVGE